MNVTTRDFKVTREGAALQREKQREELAEEMRLRAEVQMQMPGNYIVKGVMMSCNGNFSEFVAEMCSLYDKKKRDVAMALMTVGELLDDIYFTPELDNVICDIIDQFPDLRIQFVSTLVSHYGRYPNEKYYEKMFRYFYDEDGDAVASGVEALMWMFSILPECADRFRKSNPFNYLINLAVRVIGNWRDTIWFGQRGLRPLMEIAFTCACMGLRTCISVPTINFQAIHEVLIEGALQDEISVQHSIWLCSKFASQETRISLYQICHKIFYGAGRDTKIAIIWLYSTMFKIYYLDDLLKIFSDDEMLLSDVEFRHGALRCIFNCLNAFGREVLLPIEDEIVKNVGMSLFILNDDMLALALQIATMYIEDSSQKMQKMIFDNLTLLHYKTQSMDQRVKNFCLNLINIVETI